MRKHFLLFYYIRYFFFLFAVLPAMALLGLFLLLNQGLPSGRGLSTISLQEPLRIYDRQGLLLAEYGEQRRVPVAAEDIPPLLAAAFVAAEDERFYSHPGVDVQSLLRAGLDFLRNWRIEQGGSTITMQLARNFFLSRERTIVRKLREIVLALKIERHLSKQEVLTLYLNKIYLGKRAYGVAAAAQVYYNKSLDALELPQIAMIAGLPKAPSEFNPINNPQRARQRRDYVLQRMRDTGVITAADYDVALVMPLTAQAYDVSDVEVAADYIAEMARALVLAAYPDAYSGGYKVYTTLDSRLQKAANTAHRDALFRYSERQEEHRFVIQHIADLPQQLWASDAAVAAEQGDAIAAVAEQELVLDDTVRQSLDAVLEPLAQYDFMPPAVVLQLQDDSVLLYYEGGRIEQLSREHMLWALGLAPNSKNKTLLPDAVLQRGDVVLTRWLSDGQAHLTQEPQVEGALVALSPQDGAILALVGGFSYQRSKFNRATQAFRQVGSNIKPFLYHAALEKGYTAASLINDAPVVFDDPVLEGAWRPENYGGRFYGPTRLREGLIKSRNLISVRLLIDLGIAPVIRHLAHFGLPVERQPRDLSLALGSGSATPLQMATAYAVFANGGYRVMPYLIERITDRDGRVLFRPVRNVLAATDEAVADSLQQTIVLEPLPLVAAKKLSYTDDGLALDPLQGGILPAPQVLEARSTFILRDILTGVIRRGTGYAAWRALRRPDIGGKTGTTNEHYDTWFSGFSAQFAATAWVGYDRRQPLGRGETGARTALPMWVDFMRAGMADIPHQQWRRPPGLVSVRIDKRTGLPSTAGKDSLFEIFRHEYVPQPDLSQRINSGHAPTRDRAPEPASDEIF